MSEKIRVVEQPRVRHLCPSNRNRVIRPKKGGGYRRGQQGSAREEE